MSDYYLVEKVGCAARIVPVEPGGDFEAYVAGNHALPNLRPLDDYLKELNAPKLKSKTFEMRSAQNANSTTQKASLNEIGLAAVLPTHSRAGKY